MQLRASRRRTKAGPGGCCCHLAISCGNSFETLVPVLSLGFCATGPDDVQVMQVDDRFDQVGLMGEQVVTVDVE